MTNKNLPSDWKSALFFNDPIEYEVWDQYVAYRVHFYFRATLGVKEVLQSYKNSTSIFFLFGSTSLPQSKNVF